MNQTALPIRSWGAFMPPNGVGGGGVHWNAETWRFLPTDFVLKNPSHPALRRKFLPEDMTIQDWGVTYDDLEPHYDQFEYLCGTSGTAGNLKGQIQDGGNPFEGPRSRPYPTPAQPQPFSHTLFGKAARDLGYKPFPQPSGNLSQPYTNPLGVQLGPCTYCGFCEWFGCGNYSKASPQTTILPVLMRKSNFSLRDRIRGDRGSILDRFRKTRDRRDLRRYERRGMGAAGRSRHPLRLYDVQRPAAAAFEDRRSPTTRSRTRAWSAATSRTRPSRASIGFFDKDKFIFNPFIASGSIGMCIDEFNGDNFDHGPLGFVGGGYMGQVQTNGRPIETTPVPPGTPNWGAKWKQAVRDNYLSTVTPGTGVHGSFYSYRDVYLDLDPTYKDRFGRPLMRMTIDFHDNELKQNAFLTDKFAEIIKAMGASVVAEAISQGALRHHALSDDASVRRRHHGRPTQDQRASTAICRAGTCRICSCMGASAFPQNAGYNPTGTVGALAYWAADGDPRSVPQESGAARPCVESATGASRLEQCIWSLRRFLTCAAVVAGESDRAGFHPDRKAAAISQRSAIAPAATRLPVAAGPLPAADRSRRRSGMWSRLTLRRTGKPGSAPGATTNSRRPCVREFVVTASLLYPAMPYPLHQDVARRRAGDPRLSEYGRAGKQCGRGEYAAVSVQHPRRDARLERAVISHEGELQARSAKSAEWNRGAYLVEGPAHCGACHTPKSLLGGDKTDRVFARIIPAGLVRS